MAVMNVLDAGGGIQSVEKPMSVENNALLTTIDAKLALLNGYVDQLEGYVDGLEALIGTTNSTLTTIDGHVDGLEGFTDGLEGLLAALGAVGDAAWASGSGSLVALLKTIATQAASTAPVPIAQADEYETVAASATDQVIGATGASGDRLAGILIQPGTTSPGTVIIKDGTTVIYTFPGGASSVTTLIPFPVPLGLKSVNGAWKVTTGANVTVIALGDFT